MQRMGHHGDQTNEAHADRIGNLLGQRRCSRVFDFNIGHHLLGNEEHDNALDPAIFDGAMHVLPVSHDR